MLKLKIEITNVINKRAIVLAIALLLFCGMFSTFRIFVEAEVLSKWYAFVGGGLLCGLVAFLTVKTPKINICLAAGFSLCFLVINKGGWRRYFGVISLMSIIASIILSSSRAEMIALIIVSCIYSENKYYNTLKKYCEYIIVAFTVLLLALTVLFFFKKDSAIGRVLVWEGIFAN